MANQKSMMQTVKDAGVDYGGNRQFQVGGQSQPATFSEQHISSFRQQQNQLTKGQLFAETAAQAKQQK